MKVSKTWFRHALEQLASVGSVGSKCLERITLIYWVNKGERPSDEFWNDLYEILSKRIFKSLRRATISFQDRDDDHRWHIIDGFYHSRLPVLLPKIYKRGILGW